MIEKKLTKEELEKLKEENPVAYLRHQYYEIKNRKRNYTEEFLECFKHERKTPSKDKLNEKKIAKPRDPEKEV